MSLAPRLAVLTGFVALGVFALTGVLFFFIPRTANAALGHLIQRGLYLPDFSNQITLGAIGEIKTNSTPVMRVRFFTKEAPWLVRWRGSALSDFDGRQWSSPSESGEMIRLEGGRAKLVDEQQQRRPGRRIWYRVDLKPLDTDVLFFAGIPEQITMNALLLRRTSVGGYRLGLGEAAGLQYLVLALLEDSPSEPPPGVDIRIPESPLRRYLQLPTLDPRIRDLARNVTAGRPSYLAKARAVEQHLRTSYGYTLDLPREEHADPLVHFLFERRKGHCEYFASAMAVMLRSLGIPARMATGFLGGTFNPISGQYVVRASDAHTWVEAYLPGWGWATFDPTPPDTNPPASSLWSKVALYLDAADTFWQEWVVTYDLGRQLILAERLERTTRSWRFDGWNRLEGAGAVAKQAGDWLRVHGWLAALVLVIGGLTIWRGPGLARTLLIRRRIRSVRRGAIAAGDARLLYVRFLEVLRQKGYSKPSWLTAREFVRSLPATETGRLAEQFTASYQDLRFGGKVEAAPRLTVLLEELERSK